MKAHLQVVQERFTVQVANTPGLVRETHRLRYQVYCVENDYPGGDGLEVDELRSYTAVKREVMPSV
ncbi:MAG: hypothetical protein JO139_04910 [Alphaproteobacteria bacterium]|nr:hypothetical protein [Alphaproteobacteria bacterium]MBV8524786.1 hypothetical protein [Acetobacteraceae bacterium]